MEKSPEDLLRSIFGDEGPAEPRPPRNGTPLFQLSRALPEFAAETRRMLVRCDEAALADQVDELWIYDRCRCGMEDCATVYTAAETLQRPGYRGVGGGFTDTGYVLIDVADDRIVCIEMLGYRCSRCKQERRPLLDLLGVEPGRICGSLARRLGLLAAVAPYELAARLTQLLLGVTISTMGMWRLAQRLGQAAASYSEALSQYHADSRSEGASVDNAPPAVVLGVDGCTLGMQVRTHRRRRVGTEPLPALPVIEQGHFREVKTGVLLLPSEWVETSPGRRSVVRRFLVTCLGDADEIFRRLYAQVRELGWAGSHTVVVIVGDGAEWIWNRAPIFVHRCEILDFWHALEHAWTFARLRFGEDSAQADRWVHQIAEDLRAGKVQEVIAALKRLRPKTAELRQSLQSLIGYYSENAGCMRYDEYLRLGYGIGSGAVESAHKQVVHARLRQAGMRWSEAGARRLLALRLLLLNDDWALLDRLRMVSLA